MNSMMFDLSKVPPPPGGKKGGHWGYIHGHPAPVWIKPQLDWKLWLTVIGGVVTTLSAIVTLLSKLF